MGGVNSPRNKWSYRLFHPSYPYDMVYLPTFTIQINDSCREIDRSSHGSVMGYNWWFWGFGAHFVRIPFAWGNFGLAGRCSTSKTRNGTVGGSREKFDALEMPVKMTPVTSRWIPKLRWVWCFFRLTSFWEAVILNLSFGVRLDV